MKMVFSLKVIKHYLQDPLYQNSFFLATSRILNIVCGFFFWMLASRLYSVEAVGLGTALLASLNIVTILSKMGMDYSIIRFLPQNNQLRVFSTGLWIVLAASFLIGAVYILIVRYISPTLAFIQAPAYAPAFILFLAANSIVVLTGNVFTVMRQGKHYLLQNILLQSRLILLLPLTIFGGFGVFTSLGLSYVLIAAMALFFLIKIIGLEFKVDRQFITDSFKFSSRSYLSSILLYIPNEVLPLIILSLLGEAEVAKYFIAYTIGNIVLIIPDTISTSLFVEGSHGEDLRKNITKAALAIYLTLIPAVSILCLFGNYLLYLFGEKYLGAFSLVKLISLSSFLVGINYLFITIQNIRTRVDSVLILNLSRSLLLILSSYWFISRVGIIGVGWAWFFTYLVLSLGIIFWAVKEGWLKQQMPKNYPREVGVSGD